MELALCGRKGTLWNQVISRKYEVEEGGARRDGRRVRFWEDRWCGDEALSHSFPSLYALVTSKEAWVVEVWDATGEDGGWNPRFSRRFNDWEMEMVERFIFSLQGKRGYQFGG
ncbi:hypothetical protein CK203_057898 [Vitis vinifera]|uniref:Reverse transcriptase zinc-binding domain-containing protein n=1 Tax=Vitis vinifera TaxID=29760 RepID=A0A438GSB4_VITVI|nr:hypothetical protein CK203_057898 [Vitis vinifera]